MARNGVHLHLLGGCYTNSARRAQRRATSATTNTCPLTTACCTCMDKILQDVYIQQQLHTDTRRFYLPLNLDHDWPIYYPFSLFSGWIHLNGLFSPLKRRSKSTHSHPIDRVLKHGAELSRMAECPDTQPLGTRKPARLSRISHIPYPISHIHVATRTGSGEIGFVGSGHITDEFSILSIFMQFPKLRVVSRLRILLRESDEA